MKISAGRGYKSYFSVSRDLEPFAYEKSGDLKEQKFVVSNFIFSWHSIQTNLVGVHDLDSFSIYWRPFGKTNRPQSRRRPKGKDLSGVETGMAAGVDSEGTTP